MSRLAINLILILLGCLSIISIIKDKETKQHNNINFSKKSIYVKDCNSIEECFNFNDPINKNVNDLANVINYFMKNDIIFNVIPETSTGILALDTLKNTKVVNYRYTIIFEKVDMYNSNIKLTYVVSDREDNKTTESGEYLYIYKTEFNKEFCINLEVINVLIRLYKLHTNKNCYQAMKDLSIPNHYCLIIDW